MRGKRGAASDTAVGQLYRSLTEPEALEIALCQLADELKADHVLLDMRAAFQPDCESIATARVDPEHLESFATHREYPMLYRFVVNAWRGAVVCGESILDRRTQARSELYADVIRPMGGHHSLLSLTAREDCPQRPTLLAVCRGSRAKPFGQASRRHLDAFQSHLDTVVRVRQRMGMVPSDRRWQDRILDAIPTGIVLLDARGHAGFANCAARRMMRCSDAISTSSKSRIAALDPKADRQLQQAIQLALGDQLLGPSHPIRVVGRRNAVEFWLDVVRLAEHEVCSDALIDVRVAVFIRPALGFGADVGRIALAFGLTPRESTLASKLLEGHSLSSAAQGMGVGLETARTQLKNLFSKTNTNRQVDLLRLLDSMQPWSDPAPDMHD